LLITAVCVCVCARGAISVIIVMIEATHGQFFSELAKKTRYFSGAHYRSTLLFTEVPVKFTITTAIPIDFYRL